MRLALFSVGITALGLGGCGTVTPPTGTADMSVASQSCCGKPGDTGNSKGVGKYCTDSGGSECRSNSLATICSSLGDTVKRKTTFCTIPCDVTMVGYCGENASCTLDTASGQHGCTPDSCTANPPAGCMN